MPYHLVKIQILLYTSCQSLGKLFDLSEPQFLHLYNGDDYSSNSGLLKAVKRANVYKALNTALNTRTHSVNVGNYYCYYYS